MSTFEYAGAVLCLPGTAEIKGLVSGKLDSIINTYHLSVFDAEPALYALAFVGAGCSMQLQGGQSFSLPLTSGMLG